MASRSAIDVLDPRDGPTSSYKNHFDVTDGKHGGKRVFRKLEQLLRARYITPEQSEAGRRFVNDYLKGAIGRGRSCLDMGVGGGGDGHPAMERIDALSRLKAALGEVKDGKGPTLSGLSIADLLIAVVCEDQAFSPIAGRAGVSDEVVKTWVAQGLALLAGHYERIDRANGISTTVYTQEAALKRYEPEPDR